MKYELPRIYNGKNYLIFFDYDKESRKKLYIQAIEGIRFYNFPYYSFEVSLNEKIGGFTNEEKNYIYKEVQKFLEDNN